MKKKDEDKRQTRLGSRPVRRKAGSSPSHGDKSEGHSFDVVIESQITTPISTKTKPKKETPLNQGNTKKQAAAGYSSQARWRFKTLI